MRDFAIQLSHKPGELSRVAEILSRAGVNIKSIAAMTLGNLATVRIIADDVQAARGALQGANIRFEENELATVMLENRAGELALVAHKLADAHVNLHAVYVIGLDGDLIELAVAADDVKKAKKALE